jgi:hypothetical protein
MRGIGRGHPRHTTGRERKRDGPGTATPEWTAAGGSDAVGDGGRECVLIIRLDGHTDEIGDVGGVHLVHEVGAVVIDGACGNAQADGNHLGGIAGDDGVEEFAFARAEAGDAVAQDLAFAIQGIGALTGLERLEDGAREGLGNERFFEEIDGTEFHGPDGILDGGMRREHDHGAGGAAAETLFEEVKTGLAGHGEFQQEAAGDAGAFLANIGGGEGLKGVKDTHPEAGILECGFDETTDPRVVVNDEDHAGRNHVHSLGGATKFTDRPERLRSVTDACV